MPTRILLVQGVVVIVMSCLYFVIKDVSVVFFLEKVSDRSVGLSVSAGPGPLGRRGGRRSAAVALI
jgi:hypothetical protein